MNTFFVLMVATWLDKTFYGFDNGILTAMHNLGEATNYAANYFFRFISLLADEGIFMIIVSLLMIGIPLIPAVKKKKPEVARNVFFCGLSALTAMAIGLLVTNFTIKPNVARVRPYDALDLYNTWIHSVSCIYLKKLLNFGGLNEYLFCTNGSNLA